ncbi:MAG: bifunctional nuclease family protein [Bacteroidales bacterium]|nr:bifunctional nuclease family protein [Bacteroidales bacterium]
MKKIKLSVLGISYSQTQSGAYALVLSEDNGDRRLPIIIGGFEAQAIVIKLENLNPPRPLTHDLFRNFSKLMKADLEEVFIHKLEEGVFYSQLIIKKDGKEIIMDSRTSDAVALALRFNCPIYIAEEIMDKAGIVIKDNEYENVESAESKQPRSRKPSPPELSELSISELKAKLDEAVKAEDYERAAFIKDEIDRRERKGKE